MDDLIGRLLTAGLLDTLGSDEGRVEPLRSASQQLQGTLLDDRSSVPAALLAAVDEDASGSEPPLVRAQEAISDEWKTFANAFAHNGPTQVLRAVTLDSVVAASRAEPAIAQASWYVLRNIAGKVSTGRWTRTIADIIAEVNQGVDSRVAALWDPVPASSKLRMPPVPTPPEKATRKQIAEVDELRTRLGESGGNVNSVGTILFQDLPDALRALETRIALRDHDGLVKHIEQLRDFSSSLGERLREVLEAHEAVIAAQTTRDRLLWWRLATRSALLGSPYRDAEASAAAVAAAQDLHDVVPGVAPVAVEELLVDVLSDAGLAESKVTVAELVSANESVGVHVESPPGNPALTVDVVAGGAHFDALPQAMNSEMLVGDASVTLFRDLQARRLLETSDADRD